jgi:hypothetical protein
MSCSPAAILEHAARSSRYSETEILALAFAGPPPDAADLARQWHAILAEAREIVRRLPGEMAGTCVLHSGGSLYRSGPEQLVEDLASGFVQFHHGSIRGALPQIVDGS